MADLWKFVSTSDSFTYEMLDTDGNNLRFKDGSVQ